jgi:predicted permease
MSGRIRELWEKILSLFRRRTLDGEFNEELAAHIDMAVEDNIRAGMNTEEARRSALIQLGGADQTCEVQRDARGLRWLESLFGDIRYAFRGFRNSPGFTLTVIGTLALGLGVLATSFSVFNAMVLQPFAVRDPYSLYALLGWGSSNDSPPGIKWSHQFSRRVFMDFRRENPAFSEVLGYQNGNASVEKKSASIQAVTGNYFTMLGGRICMGRAILEMDDESGEGVAVASYAAWKSRFGADTGVVGKTMQIGEKTMEIVGVACPEFNGPQKERVDFWVSLALARELADPDRTVEYSLGPDKTIISKPIEFPRLMITGRLKPGFTQESAEVALLAYGKEAYRAWPRWNRPPERAWIQQQATSFPLNRDTLRIFMPTFLAFGLVLLISCANVSNIMLARGLARQHEIGIRISLGAGRARMIRQLLTESLLLAMPAALAAFGVAYGIIQAGYWLQTAILPASGVGSVAGLPKTIMANVDLAHSLPGLRVLAFLLVTALISTLVFGLAPAIQTTRSSVVLAGRGAFVGGYRSARLRSALVIVQSALSALLLILAGMAMRNEIRISSQDLGLDIRGVFSIQISNKVNRQAVLDRLSSLPSTDSIGACLRAPLGTITGFSNFPGKWVGENGIVEFASIVMSVSPEYFDVYKIAVRGSKAATEDGNSAIISETFARRLWPSSDALGRTTMLEMPVGKTGRTMRWNYRVVGVASDSVFDLNDSTGAPKPNRALLYEVTPLTEWLSAKPSSPLTDPSSPIVVRMKGNPGIARLLLQKTMEDATPGDTHYQILSAQDQLDRFLYPYRALSVISGFLGVLAFFLTASGVFGMLSYVVTQRRKEFGIRIALGAGKASVTGLVLRQSLRLAAAGSVLGALAALAVARVMSHHINQIDFFDAGGYAMGILLVIAAALVASWIPARRAVNVDPVRTLHCD